MEQAPVIASLLADHLSELGVLDAYPYLHLYWSESGRFPFLIISDTHIVGFALVRTLQTSTTFELAELYVCPKARRKGLARDALKILLSLLPGVWELSVNPANTAGLNFWFAILPAQVTALSHAQTDRLTFKFNAELFHRAEVHHPKINTAVNLSRSGMD